MSVLDDKYYFLKSALFILVIFPQYIFLECIYNCMNSWNTFLWIPANIFMMNKDHYQEKYFSCFQFFLY